MRTKPMLKRRALLLFLLSLAFCGVEHTLAQTGEITIQQAHLFLWPMGEQLWIVEHYLISNAGTEPLQTEDVASEGLRFQLPPGALLTGAGAEEEGAFTERRYRLTEDAVIFTASIPPGVTPVEVQFNYTLPLQHGQPLTRTFPLPVESAVLLVMGTEWQLSGSALMGFGRMEVNGRTARGYTVEPLHTGATLHFTLEPASELSIPATAAPAASAFTNADLLLGTAALLLASGMAIWFWRPTSPPVPPMPENVRQTVTEIAALDARYQQGEIAPPLYREEREALIAQIRRQLEGPAHDRDDRDARA